MITKSISNLVFAFTLVKISGYEKLSSKAKREDHANEDPINITMSSFLGQWWELGWVRWKLLQSLKANSSNQIIDALSTVPPSQMEKPFVDHILFWQGLY